MRLLIFAILVTAFVAVTSQNEGRTRARGLRRFALSTPALRAAKTDDKEANALIEENLTDSQAPFEPQTRSRGTNPLRRGRPSLRLRGRTGDQTDSSPITASGDIDTKVEPSETSEGRRGAAAVAGGGLRIRRPLKKITTTTTTTTTEQPIEENIATELPEMQQSTSTNEQVKEKQVEGMLTEESNAVLKDEGMQDKKENLMTEKKMENPFAQEDPIKEEVISEPMSESLPKMKKLRPIPIKIRRRGKEDKPQLEESPKEIANPEPEQLGAEDAKQASSHRFSPRPRPRIQSRRRPINKESALGVEAEQETEGSAVATAEQNIPSETSKRIRSRGDVPNLRRRPSRISLKQQPTEATESQPENTFVEEAALEESQPVNRNTNTNQFEETLKQIAVFKGNVEPANKRVRIRPRIQTPSTPIDTLKEDAATKNLNDASGSFLEAPISDAVKAGRLSQRTEVTEQEQISQRRGTASQISKSRTPHYGGSDLIFKGGEVQVTQIGTIEDTPIEQVHTILSGFGSRRRGLARPRNPTKEIQVQTKTNEQTNSPLNEKSATDSLTASSDLELTSDLEVLYDYYQ